VFGRIEIERVDGAPVRERRSAWHSDAGFSHRKGCAAGLRRRTIHLVATRYYAA
jgi:hypothetical protein